MKIFCVIVLSIIAPSFAYSGDWFEGENLLTQPPDDEHYEAYVKKEPGWLSQMWQSRNYGGGDNYVVNIVSGHRSNLGKFRGSQDRPGKESCDSFTSSLIDDSERNDYKSVFWETTCVVRGTTIRSIQLAIAGRDSLYHVRKLWKIPVTNEDIGSWKDSIGEISLCDTRRKKNSCPEGFERVDDT
jgi:hypothetical protein